MTAWVRSTGRAHASLTPGSGGPRMKANSTEGKDLAKRLIEKPDIYTSFPTPLALVTCADRDGKGNVLTIAWVGVVCSDPPMVSISLRRGKYSHELIKASGEFVLNVPTEALVKETDYVGSVSGKNVDKWSATGLTPLPATRVKAPLIAQSPINLECVVRHMLHLGTHDAFIGEVVASHVDPDLLNEDKLDPGRVHPLVYYCRDYWALAPEKLAKRGVGLPKD